MRPSIFSMPRLTAALLSASVALGAGLIPAHAIDAEAARAATAGIDTARITAADEEPGNWLSHGRTYSEQRFSPLTSINEETVETLGLEWFVDLATQRGVEATPIVVDGVMYLTGPWSVVWALDARTGEELWYYDPQVDRARGQYACCDVVNRGPAVYQGKVFVATIDGRLVALDAGSGEVVWDKLTLDQSKPYTITGAPRVVKGKVIIGNGGAELGVRGFFSAFDVETGEMVWRFYTVPASPDGPFEHKELETAVKTWDPKGVWPTSGGGGTVWDSFAYDPELDLLYVGVGNGSPWARHVRSPAGGDNLYLSSILAVRPDTGELVWHYQTTPADNWDYTATQHMILADIEIFGETRQVLMQAPKNGFFYVLDRVTGELLSADKFVPSNWASHVDLATGRPIETGAGVYADAPKIVFPGPAGGHSWHPMAYSPLTGLVYIPALEVPAVMEPNLDYEHREGWWNTGTVIQQQPLDAPPELLKGRILAWDPVRGKARWRFEHWGHWNGGLLATAGNLVFQGGGDGLFRAFKADDGKLLWSAPAQTGVIAAPVTYELDGEQYVTVTVGWGGVGALAYGRASKAAGVTHVGRVLTFKLGGDKTLPPNRPAADIPEPPADTASEEDIRAGAVEFHDYCAVCHGFGAVGGGVIPDLRHSAPATHAMWQEIVLEGALSGNGMGRFDRWLTPEQSAQIQAYVIRRAHEGDLPPSQ